MTPEPAQPAESPEARAIKVYARAWWALHMPNSICKLVEIKGDGRVDVHWSDADESGKYTLPVDFMLAATTARPTERGAVEE